MSDETIEPEPPVLEESLAEALDELEAYLNAQPDSKLMELTLPFGSRWVLNDAGLDITRLRDEADVLVKATPLSDRILDNHLGHVTYWVSQRMMLDANEERQPEMAATQLEVARATLAQRADLLDEQGFPLVATGLRRAAEESSGGAPPDDLLWTAMATRIAESVL
jgi:hypothetical protein